MLPAPRIDFDHRLDMPVNPVTLTSTAIYDRQPHSGSKLPIGTSSMVPMHGSESAI